jgi:hypothetical protein
MRKMLLIFIVLLSFTAGSIYPQIQNSTILKKMHSTENNREQNSDILKIFMDKLPVEQSRVVNKALLKLDNVYKPVKVISDSTKMDTYKYDTKGNISSIVSSKLLKSIWVDTSKIVYEYDSDNYAAIILTSSKVNDQWVDSMRTTYTYNSDKALTSMVAEINKGNQWSFSFRGFVTYDGRKIISAVSEMYMADGSIISTRNTRTYNDKNELIGKIDEKGLNNVFTNYYRSTYTYYESGKPLAWMKEEWKENAWSIHDRESYTYDNKNNMLTTLYEYWQNEAWNNNSRDTYTYDDKNNVLTQLSEKYSNDLSLWENVSKLTYTYTGDGKVITKYEQVWGNEEGWLNVSLDVFNYNDLGKTTSEIYYDYGYPDLGNYKYIYTYDENNHLIKGEHFGFNNGSWIPSKGGMYFTSDDDSEYYCSAAKMEVQYELIPCAVTDGSSALPNEYKLYQNYPNPFNPSTKIKFTLPETAKVTVRVYDMLGREIRTLVNAEHTSGTHEVIWSGDNDMGQKVASGIYMYSISTSKFVQTKKMILLK